MSIKTESFPEFKNCSWGAYCGYCAGRGYMQHNCLIPDFKEDYDCQLYKELLPQIFNRFLDDYSANLFSVWVKEILMRN